MNNQVVENLKKIVVKEKITDNRLLYLLRDCTIREEMSILGIVSTFVYKAFDGAIQYKLDKKSLLSNYYILTKRLNEVEDMMEY